MGSVTHHLLFGKTAGVWMSGRLVGRARAQVPRRAGPAPEAHDAALRACLAEDQIWNVAEPLCGGVQSYLTSPLLTCFAAGCNISTFVAVLCVAEL